MFVKVVLLLNEIYNKSVCTYQFGCGSWKEIDNKRTCKWWWYKTLSLCLTNVSYWECTSGNCTWKFIWLFWVYIIYYPHHTDERIWRKVDIITSDFETWGFHRRENVNYDLMGCDAIWSRWAGSVLFFEGASVCFHQYLGARSGSCMCSLSACCLAVWLLCETFIAFLHHTRNIKILEEHICLENEGDMFPKMLVL